VNVDDAIRDFAAAEHELPRDSMLWALDNWPIAGPRFVEQLDRYADGIERTDETANALFFMVHLLGEKGETKAFPSLRRLLLDKSASRTVLGNGITETLRGIIISTYDGDTTGLKEIIESSAADEFSRGAALEAMAYVTRTGSIADAETRAYLLHLLTELQPQAGCHVWTDWCISAANLGYEDFVGHVAELFRRRFVPHYDMTMNDFKEQLCRTLDDPARMAGFEYDRIRPFEDAIGTLSKWYGFSEQFKIDEERRAARADEEPLLPTLDQPYINPNRQVGRNDPCPCGSGKKYKKCCLK
jgi:uncharacterized protein